MEGDHLENQGADGKILRWIFRKWNGGMDWIDLAQYRDRWRALVNALYVSSLYVAIISKVTQTLNKK
jgi:hypothetical protein